MWDMEPILTETEAGIGTLIEEVSILGRRYRIGIMTVTETVTEIIIGITEILPLIEVGVTIHPITRAIIITTTNAMLERNTISGTERLAIETTIPVIGPQGKEMNLLASPIGMEGTSGIRETREISVLPQTAMMNTQTPGVNGRKKLGNIPPFLSSHFPH